MVDVYDIYLEVCGKVNKEENGYLPADLFNIYGRDANRYVFNDYIARLQNPQVAAAEKQKLEDRLAPFEIRAPQTATQGLFTVPADSAYFRSAKMKFDNGAAAATLLALNAQLCDDADPTIDRAAIQRQIDALVFGAGLVGVTLLDHDQLSKRMNSPVPGKKPSRAKPVMERATINGVRGFQVFPAEDTSIILNYYRRPALPKLVMTPDPLTYELVYDKAASSQFEWEEEAMTDVVNKICLDFATYIRETGFFQMTQAEQKP